MKKGIVLIIMAILLFFFLNYRFDLDFKVVNVETNNIVAEIEDTNYKSGDSSITMIPSGNTMIPITNTEPDEYIVKLKYDGHSYLLDNEDFYYICKGNNGKKVNCELTVYHYANGNSKKGIKVLSLAS